MTIPHIVDRTPDAMTPRARTYIAAGGWRHFLVGLTMLLTPWLYGSAAFIPIFNLLPLAAWGWVTTVIGAVCLTGSFTRKGDIARWGIVGSAVATLVLAAGLSWGVVGVWAEWLNAIGADRALQLFVDHPNAFPVDLIVGPLVGTSSVPPSPFLPLVMLALTVKDFTMCAQPLRVPFEERVGVRRPRPA